MKSFQAIDQAFGHANFVCWANTAAPPQSSGLSASAHPQDPLEQDATRPRGRDRRCAPISRGRYPSDPTREGEAVSRTRRSSKNRSKSSTPVGRRRSWRLADGARRLGRMAIIDSTLADQCAGVGSVNVLNQVCGHLLLFRHWRPQVVNKASGGSRQLAGRRVEMPALKLTVTVSQRSCRFSGSRIKIHP